MMAELYHFGIKGMKWGVRRYQKNDGTLTAAGKKRYSDDSKKPSLFEKRTQKLEKEYRDAGMNARNARLAAERRVKTEKLLLALGATAAVAATAYVVRNKLDDRADSIIKSGQKMQVIGATDTKKFDKAFYAAYKKSDEIKYKGMYGSVLAAKNTATGGEHSAFKYTLKANSDIKVASRKTASDTFAELYKNDAEFRNAFLRSNERFKNPLMKAGRVAGKVGTNMSDSKLKKAGYDAFNIGLVNHDNDGSYASKRFYDELKKKGYGAIRDVNDKKFSGYKAKAPTIIFDNNGKVSVDSVKKVKTGELALNRNLGQLMINAGTLGAIGGAAAGYSSATKTEAINSYRLEHPNTKLNDNEILKAINRKGY